MILNPFEPLAFILAAAYVGSFVFIIAVSIAAATVLKFGEQWKRLFLLITLGLLLAGALTFVHTVHSGVFPAIFLEWRGWIYVLGVSGLFSVPVVLLTFLVGGTVMRLVDWTKNR